MKANRDKTINNNRQAIVGVQKYFATTPTIVLDGKPTTPKDVIATLQGAIDSIDTAAVAEKAFHDAVSAQHAAIAKGNAVLKLLKMLVQNQLGGAEGVLGDFGFQIPKRKTPNEATKAAAVAKRAATRDARHTMGKRQKAKVTGKAPAAPATPPTAAKPT
ncbi:MAG: hypothetical protein M3O46_02985 [Myxococcota bacterium]|nr:hypothetical protein [Myxococcota bacterium]